MALVACPPEEGARERNDKKQPSVIPSPPPALLQSSAVPCEKLDFQKAQVASPLRLAPAQQQVQPRTPKRLADDDPMAASPLTLKTLDVDDMEGVAELNPYFKDKLERTKGGTCSETGEPRALTDRVARTYALIPQREMPSARQPTLTEKEDNCTKVCRARLTFTP